MYTCQCLYYRVVSQPGKPGIVRKFSSIWEKSGKCQLISQKWQKFEKSLKIWVSWNECCENSFQHSFNFTFIEQFLSHFVSFLFYNSASKDSAFIWHAKVFIDKNVVKLNECQLMGTQTTCELRNQWKKSGGGKRILKSWNVVHPILKKGCIYVENISMWKF